MKAPIQIILIIFSVLFIEGCKSTTDLGDVRDQERRAIESLDETKSEMLRLAEVKEQYIKDRKRERIEELEEKQEGLMEDIGQLAKVSSEEAKEASGELVDDLQARKKEIDRQLREAKKMPTEDWTESIDRINQRITQLQEEIALITENLGEREEF